MLTNPENLGFVQSCNRGAREASGEVVVFLNNDTLPEPGWLSPLLASLRDPRVGAVTEPWNDEDELVPIDFVDHIVGPAGVLPSAQALRDCSCPIAPELLGIIDDG